MNERFILVDVYGDKESLRLFRDAEGLYDALEAFQEFDRAYIQGKILDEDYEGFGTFMEKRGFPVLEWEWECIA